MTGIEQPQIYLISPREIVLSTFPQALALVLDAHDIACLRLALSSTDESHLSRAADVCRDVAHARDVAIVFENHILLSQTHGLDGVHLTDGARSVRKARTELGDDAIIGSFCGNSRHDGMSAGETGADYISFGPVGQTSLGDGTQAERDVFQWWSEMIEIPVVAEGSLTAERIKDLSPVTDFFGIGPEIWSHDDPAQELARLKSAFS